MPYKNELRAKAARMKGSIHNKNAVLVDYEFITTDNLEKMLKRARLCPCCSQLMVLKFDRYDGRCMTIDRVVPRSCYTKGNIQIICAACNQAKSDSTLKELQQVCSYIQKHQPEEVEEGPVDDSFNATRFRQQRRSKFKGVLP